MTLNHKSLYYSRAYYKESRASGGEILTLILDWPCCSSGASRARQWLFSLPFLCSNYAGLILSGIGKNLNGYSLAST